MKKLIVLVVLFAVLMTGCNRSIADVTYAYDRAIIKLANDEVIEVKIRKWCDYEGEQIQIIAEDGTVYLTNSFRCDLIKDKEK